MNNYEDARSIMTNLNPFGLPAELPDAARPARVWAPLDELDPDTLEQIRNVTEMPWLHGVAVMPDVHLGYGVPIGSVLALKNAISPAAVGVDIGCGMAAVKTNVRLEQLPEDLGPMRLAIEAAVPVGRESYSEQAPVRDGRLAEFRAAHMSTFDQLVAPVENLKARAVAQCGTLGGGNHFIEVCRDEDGAVWLTLHSGSRRIGKEIADWHVARAKELPWNQDLADADLAVFLRTSPCCGRTTPGWREYVWDLVWAQRYAELNRRIMLEQVSLAFAESLGSPATEGSRTGVEFERPISCHHNYVAFEEHDGQELVVTRKGAIFAGDGALGIIPGSMGTGSYIVRGLGNPASYNSASHGAGRTMSRGAARRTFSVEDLAAQTAGVECRKDEGVLDEAPGAYKDLATVIAREADLVEPIARLTTLLCVKG